MYDSQGSSDVRLLDGPLTAAGTPGYFAPGTGFLPALDGSDATGVAVPTGGAGIRGWLSGLYSFISKLTFTSSNLNVNIAGGSTAGPYPNAKSAVAAAASAAALKSTAGNLFGITVTAQGTAQMTFTDGPGGTVLAVIPANQPVGDVPLYGIARPYATSLYANSAAGTPAIVAFYN